MQNKQRPRSLATGPEADDGSPETPSRGPPSRDDPMSPLTPVQTNFHFDLGAMAQKSSLQTGKASGRKSSLGPAELAPREKDGAIPHEVLFQCYARNIPSQQGEKKSVLKEGEIVYVTDSKNTWVRHDKGWTLKADSQGMILCDLSSISDDTNVTHCPLCKTEFVPVIAPKTHCRKCGGCFCTKCCNKSNKQKIKTCKTCLSLT